MKKFKLFKKRNRKFWEGSCCCRLVTSLFLKWEKCYYSETEQIFFEKNYLLS